MNIETAEDHYIANLDKPWGRDFAATVGRFQDGFLRDNVCRDCDEAFARAVAVTLRLLPAIKAKFAQ